MRSRVLAGKTSAVEREAVLLKAVGHPVRLTLLGALRQGEECVCHLSHLLGRPQPYVSKQLAEMRKAGLVVDRRDGQRVYYRLADPRIEDLLAAARRLSGAADEPRPRKLAGCPCPQCG